MKGPNISRRQSVRVQHGRQRGSLRSNQANQPSNRSCSRRKETHRKDREKGRNEICAGKEKHDCRISNRRQTEQSEVSTKSSQLQHGHGALQTAIRKLVVD